jgi:hypothetical protein
MLLEQVGFQDHFNQLFDKERHPVGFGHHLLEHFCGQRFAARYPLHNGLGLGTG